MPERITVALEKSTHKKLMQIKKATGLPVRILLIRAVEEYAAKQKSEATA